MVFCWRRFFYHTGGPLKESGYAGELIAQSDASMDIPAIAPGTLHREEVYAQKAKEQKTTETMSKLEAWPYKQFSQHKTFFFMTRTHTMTGMVLLLFFLVLGALPASAQEMRTFAKLGANLSTITDDEADYRLGFGGGLSIERPFNRSSSGVLEVLYLGLGGNYSNETTTSFGTQKFEAEWRLSYIGVPALWHYRFNTNTPNVSPRLFAGYALLFRTSSKVSAGSVTIKGEEGVRKVDHGFMLGAGFDFMISRQEFIVEGRYYQGVSDLSTVADVEGKNRAFWLSAGIRLF